MKQGREERPEGVEQRHVSEHKSGPLGPAATSTSTSTSSAQQIAATALQSIASILPFKTDTNTNTKTSADTSTNLERQMNGKNNGMDGNQENNSTSGQNGDEETVTF